MKVVQKRYNKAALQVLTEQGVIKPFCLGPQVGEIAKVLNTVYENRMDINKQEVINGIPVHIRIMVDKADGVPWSWSFTFNLTQAKRNGYILDTGKVRELAERFSFPSNKVLVEAVSHPFWTSGEQRLQVSALNLPPAQMVSLFQAIFSEAVHPMNKY